jgi:hypothetical protein
MGRLSRKEVSEGRRFQLPAEARNIQVIGFKTKI